MTKDLLARALNQKAVDYEKQLTTMVRHMAAEIVKGAKSRVRQNQSQPKSDSPLAASLQVMDLGDGALKVITDKPYARYVEFGTLHQRARPFLTPATEEVKVTFQDLIPSN